MFAVKIVYCQVTMEFVEVPENREGTRYESQSAQSMQDRRKLLKRTRSLAVISEDESRQDRDSRHLRLGQSTFDLPRRHQLIPRAKLIDRNSLKDRLCKSQQHLSDSYEQFNEAKSYHSRSTCGLHSIPSGLASLPDPLPHARGNRGDSDRLNILDWPDPPRRYRSVQSLDTVSGLVDIVEDNWPIEGNRSIDCIYTQVKRKRKEHRSLDSILFEDDDELEYFDVLNLLPLSNVRLEFDEADARNNNLLGREKTKGHSDPEKLKSLEYLKSTDDRSPTRSNATDEEKCKGNTIKEGTNSHEHPENHESNLTKEFLLEKYREELSSRNSETSREETQENSIDENDSVIFSTKESIEESTSSIIDQDKYRADVALVTPCEEDLAEDYKSIWISDTDDHEDMSRRPQVLKVVDNDVTKRRHRHSTVEIDFEDATRDAKLQDLSKESNGRFEPTKLARRENQVDGSRINGVEAGQDECKEKVGVENARNFFEQKTVQEITRSKQNEGRFERIVKETSNILGKACNAVKGSLGFEARSESSDLGLGSETGSDTRRRSVDDGIDEDQTSGCIDKASTDGKTNDGTKTHTNLTRSRSCMDSIECQDDGPEFDHVRYKIVKSNMFSKNMYNTGRGDVTYDGLMQYLREYSFQELLLDNNVVIIEPVRAEAIERKSSTIGKVRGEPTCKIAGAIQKRDTDGQDRSNEKIDGGSAKSPKQSSIRKHFFYQPIRVNRELIDEELPDPDTVRNVRRMFENTLKPKNVSHEAFSRDCKTRKSVSMKDLSSIDDGHFDDVAEKVHEVSRCSSRAKDLTRLFENLEKSTSSNASVAGGKDELDSPRSESKTRILAQSFEARSGHTSPSNSTSSKNKVNRYHHHHHNNWDSGSVSSGVSSDYPDTDHGSGAHCTSSDDEEVDCHDDEDNDAQGPGHYVSQDVLKKIRECGTSVTYYGGKVVNSSNGPLISPLVENRFKRIDPSNDYVKFRLVKSNSCDSRLELTGRFVEGQTRCRNRDGGSDLSQYTIAETPSIEITTAERQEKEEKETTMNPETKREPPVVIGLEPKKEDQKDGKFFKADFKLGNLDDAKSNYPSRFVGSALTRWQVNESNWKTPDDFGKMEFEEFEVLEDSLNGTESQRSESS